MQIIDHFSCRSPNVFTLSALYSLNIHPRRPTCSKGTLRAINLIMSLALMMTYGSYVFLVVDTVMLPSIKSNWHWRFWNDGKTKNQMKILSSFGGKERKYLSTPNVFRSGELDVMSHWPMVKIKRVQKQCHLHCNNNCPFIGLIMIVSSIAMA